MYLFSLSSTKAVVFYDSFILSEKIQQLNKSKVCMRAAINLITFISLCEASCNVCLLQILRSKEDILLSMWSHDVGMCSLDLWSWTIYVFLYHKARFVGDMFLLLTITANNFESSKQQEKQKLTFLVTRL